MKDFVNLRKGLTLLLLLILLGCKTSSDEFSSLLENGGGGEGTASIAITSYSPPVATISIKDSVISKQFLVSATGQGTLRYDWTLDGSDIGTNAPTYNVNATQLSVGNHTLKVTITDEIGTTSQEWDVKINGSPVISSSTPSPTSVHLRRTTLLNFSTNVTDPNSDTLIYVWKLDGQENVLSSTTNNVDWTPAATDVGTHIVSVDIYDGPASDEGTYKVTRSWTTYVNHFSNSCNLLENESRTNQACVLVGIAGAGDGLRANLDASSFYVRPTAMTSTSDNNFFFADDFNHAVWFYNKNTSPSITVAGITVPVGTIKVVAGVGMASSGNSSSSKGTRNFLSSPNGVYWDEANSNLYISDTSNNRVFRLDSSGDLTSVISAGCTSPRQMTMVGSTLYVACYSNNIIMSLNTVSLATAVFAGVSGGAANPTNLNESTYTDGTNGKLNGPIGLTSDAAGNIYVGEYGGCRVRVYNQTAGPLTLFGTWTISSNRQRTIAGKAAGCSPTAASGEPVDLTGAADAVINSVRGLSFNSDGLLLVAGDLDVIEALNMGSTTSLFGVSVPASTVTIVMGTSGGYSGEGQLASATRFNNPFIALEDTDTGDYYIADYSNGRLRRARSSDFKMELVAGNGSSRAQTNAGQGLLEVGQEKMSGVRGIAVDSVSGEVFVADQSNHRIRVINRYGQSQQAIGTGASGTGTEENDYPSNITMNQPRGVALVGKTATFGGHLVFCDSQNHKIRLWNRLSSTQTLFGVSVEGGKVVTIGGNGSSGTATSGSALQAAFNQPGGITTDGTDLFIADTGNHCIKKIDASGNLSVVAGLCGSAGNGDGTVGTATLNGPEGLDYYSDGTHSGVVIASRGNSRVKFHHLVGDASTLLFGNPIPADYTSTIGCTGAYHNEGSNATSAPCSQVYDVAVVGTKVCFSNFYYHNVRCIDDQGKIRTLMGAVQGINSTTNLFFPGPSFAASDYDAATPNYMSQNGVTAFYLPSPLLAAPPLNTSFGQLVYPMSVRAVDDHTVLIGEYYLGLIRKVKLP